MITLGDLRAVSGEPTGYACTRLNAVAASRSERPRNMRWSATGLRAKDRLAKLKLHM